MRMILNLRERLLIERFRACDDRGKDGIEAMSIIEIQMMEELRVMKAENVAPQSEINDCRVMQLRTVKE